MSPRKGAKAGHLHASNRQSSAYSAGVNTPSCPSSSPAAPRPSCARHTTASRWLGAGLGRGSGHWLGHWVSDACLLLCFVLLLGFLSPASAQTQTTLAQLPATAVQQALGLARQAAAVAAPAKARVVAEAGTLDPRLTLAPCARVEAQLLAGVPAWGRTRVGLRCTDGPVRWNVSLPIQVQVWAPAVVLLVDLPSGTRLSSEHLGLAEVDWGATSGLPAAKADAVQGRNLVRPMAAGLALRPADLQTRQWFARGDTVQVMAAGAGFAIAADGEALGPGLEGQSVRVRVGGNPANPTGADSGRVVVGKAVAERRVEVQL
jgi:flagellar basal body P-ring formation protein FlgA